MIIPELRVYATLRYLSGASYLDLCVFCGFAPATFYNVVWRTIDAINESLQIHFPQTCEECALAASEFENKSTGGIINNCVGAIDGYLLSIKTPSKEEAGNVRSYFSGHYQKYGINIQACCDVLCCFSFMGIGGTGVSKD